MTAIDSKTLCAICKQPADKLYESTFSGDMLCDACDRAEQEEVFGGATTPESEQYLGIHIVREGE